MALIVVPAARAQEDEGSGTFGRVGDYQTGGVAYHVFTRSGEATVQVLVVGSVGNPGMYEIGVNTDLGELMALSGGPPLTSSNPNINREITVRLYRLEGDRRREIYEASYERVLEEPGTYPPLQDGDVLTVETLERQRFTWRNALSIIGSVAGVLLVVDRLFGIFPRRR